MQYINSILTFSLFAGVLSCGVDYPGVKKLPTGSVLKPEFQKTQEVFQLQKEPTSVSQVFEGSILIWKENNDVKLMRNVLDRSIDAKETDAQYKKVAFADDKLWVELQAVKQKIKETKAPLEEKSEGKIQAFYKNQSLGATPGQGLLGKSSTWYKDQIPAEKLDEVNQTCDALLIRFALSDFALNFKFTSRPIPSALCEEFYKTRGFFTDASCQDSTVPKDYSTCLWGKSGVMKSTFKFFTLSAEELAPDEEGKLVKSIEDGSFRTLVAQKRSLFLSLGKIGNYKLLSIAEKKKFKDYFSKALSAFVPSASSSLGELMTEQTEENVSRGYKFTFNDLLHNFYRLGTVDDEQAIKVPESLQEKMKKLNAALPSIFGEELALVSSISPEKRAALQKDLADYEKKSASLNAQRWDLMEPLTDLLTVWKDVQAKTANFVSDHDLASTLWPAVQITTNNFQNMLMIELQLDSENSTNKAKGCFELKSKQGIPCPKAYITEDVLPMEIEYNIDSGKLGMKIFLDNPSNFGWSRIEKDEKSPRFNKLSSKKIEKTVLVVETYPRKFGGIVDMLTGKVFIFDKNSSFKEGDELYQGSITMSTPELTKNVDKIPNKP